MANEAELVAPCGMNCARCSSYLAWRNGLWEKGIAVHYCAGCRPKKKKCGHLMKDCSLLRKGQVRFCYECKDFPCARLKAIDERYRSRYRMSMIDNLELIRRSGIDALLAKEREMWSCKCGGLISCHNGICFACGLEELKKRKTWNMNRW